MPRSRSGTRVTNRLIALSSAAILTVYSAGYLRTRGAATKLLAAERARVFIPGSPRDTTPREIQPLPTASSQPAAAAVTRTATPERTPRETTPSPVASPIAEPVPTPTAAPASTTTAASPTPTPVEALVASPTPSPTPAPPAYKDGTFSGWGTSRHGDIEATVVISSGKIMSAVISQCLTRYSCSWVAHLQGQVVERQSAEVDYVTGATQSTNAFYYAVAQALSKAK